MSKETVYFKTKEEYKSYADLQYELCRKNYFSQLFTYSKTKKFFVNKAKEDFPNMTKVEIENEYKTIKAKEKEVEHAKKNS